MDAFRHDARSYRSSAVHGSFLLRATRGYRWNDGKFNTMRAWWIETRDEKAEREFLVGIGCKTPKVVRQTALERYRSLAARAGTEADKAAADEHANDD